MAYLLVYLWVPLLDLSVQRWVLVLDHLGQVLELMLVLSTIAFQKLHSHFSY